MSAFTNGFNFGFVSGMFNRMFSSLSPFAFFDSSPMFFTPNYSQNVFTPYNVPMPSMPSLWNGSTMSMAQSNFNAPVFNFNMSNFTPRFDYFDSSFSFSNSNNVSSVTAPRTSGDFDKMLKFVLSNEGGYTPNDCGQAANKGIQQRTYDAYRKKKGLPKQSVKNITNAEVKDCYYNDFYKASGADKIKDAKLALYVFDTAVNMGVGTARVLLSKCGNDPEKFIKLRIAKYNSIAANDSSKQQYLKGWKNRVNKAKAFANKEFVA